MTRSLALVLALVLLGLSVAVVDAREHAGGGPVDPAGMQTVIVTMRTRADLSTVVGRTRAARQEGTIRALQAHRAKSQAGLMAYLAGQAVRGRVARETSFWVFNGLSLTATPDVIAEVAARPDVASVTSDEIAIVPLEVAAPAPTPVGAPTSAAPDEANIALTNAPAMWALGYTGQGVVVANLDSGVDATHPDLASRWRGGTNSWFDPYGQHPTTPIDLTGHGTATMGVMVGGDAGGTSIGMAPGATWIAAKIFNDSGVATSTAIHAAFQWVLDPDGNPATADAPQIVNNSWAYGLPGCNLTFQSDLRALRAAQIVPVFAAGNYGPGASTSVSPANYPEALAVGATSDGDTVDSSSSRGPSACSEPSTTYPDVVAPGMDIWTSDRFGLYQSATGTSLAAPHVAGALALLMSAHPGVTAPYLATALTASGRDLGVAGPDNTFGRGRIDVAAADAWVAANPPPPPPTVTGISPDSGPTSGGTVVTVSGTGFGATPGTTAVVFGTIAATGVTCTSTTMCTATAPAGVASTVDVRVTVASQTSAVSTVDRFTYVAPPPPLAVTGISPNTGPTAGGTTFTITGAGFGTGPGSTSVVVGTAAASGVTCASTTSCTATAPAGSVGTVDVRVTVGGQTSPVVTADRFTYAATATTQTVAIPALARNQGYWFTVTSSASGSVAATWTLPTQVQGTLSIYAGNPFAGGANPVRRNPPSGALATTSGRRATFSVATGARPAGLYTVYVYAGANTPSSTGTVTALR